MVPAFVSPMYFYDDASECWVNVKVRYRSEMRPNRFGIPT